MRITDVPGTSFRDVVLYFYGSLLNQGLPTTVGGDVYRAVAASSLRLEGKAPGLMRIFSDARFALIRINVTVVILDRLCGLLGNLLLAAIAMIWTGPMIAPWVGVVGYVMLAVILVFAAAAALLLQYESVSRRLEGLALALSMPSVFPLLGRLFSWPTSVLEILRSLVIHLFAIAGLICCLRAVGVEPPLEALLLVFSAVGLLIMLPISVHVGF